MTIEKQGANNFSASNSNIPAAQAQVILGRMPYATELWQTAKGRED
jgi:hypothetical protein